MTRIPAEQRRRELIDAALRVMARDGIAATSTRAIVSEAGMPLGAFHYCFRSKQELLRELTSAVVAQEMAAAAAVLRPGKDLADTLREGLRSWWSMVTRNPGQQQVLYELTHYALRTPGLEDVAAQQYRIYHASAAEILTVTAHTSGTAWTMPVEVVARMLVSVLDGVTLGWLVDRDGEAALAQFDSFAAHLASLARPTRAVRRRSESQAR